MSLYLLLTLTSAAYYHQTTYSKCDQVIGYWSPWGSWSAECKCKDNYEVTRFGRRYVKERRRQCFCGGDGIISGCDTWCGQPHAFTDEDYCDESLTFDWSPWSVCINLRQRRTKINCQATGCSAEAKCQEIQAQTESQSCNPCDTPDWRPLQLSTGEIKCLIKQGIATLPTAIIHCSSLAANVSVPLSSQQNKEYSAFYLENSGGLFFFQNKVQTHP